MKTRESAANTDTNKNGIHECESLFLVTHMVRVVLVCPAIQKQTNTFSVAVLSGINQRRTSVVLRLRHIHAICRPSPSSPMNRPPPRHQRRFDEENVIYWNKTVENKEEFQIKEIIYGVTTQRSITLWLAFKQAQNANHYTCDKMKEEYSITCHAHIVRGFFVGPTVHKKTHTVGVTMECGINQRCVSILRVAWRHDDQPSAIDWTPQIIHVGKIRVK